ncbi:carbon monoxide dehydrogenase subunit G [Kiloniella laminariae]|uniref:Carbon monoxide dehydrogenase subunit G n=1 Tax=Kiloniella laminariae TaxID=454162 RepID=A0ABT4LKF1_9PROT|nr:carbon monoxide dehydrogenase subunit G [Kiloniella laminariae]MCZ4281430.1 carbon monoxide dehydrogenase subunit G [Kiloniella laminariae]
MEMEGQQLIPASQNRVWEALNDPEILQRSIPGCDSVEKTSDTELQASLTAKVGPVKAKFKGQVTLSDLDPPNGYTLTGEGKGGAAGFGKGQARVTLETQNGQTLLTYSVNAKVGGKLAQIGSRLVDAAAKKMADDFFATFTEIVGEIDLENQPKNLSGVVSSTSADAQADTQKPSTAGGTGYTPFYWIAAAILIVVAVYQLS